MKSYEKYQLAVKDKKEAEQWLALKDAINFQNGKTFSLSLKYSKFLLMRCGQYSAGEKFYRESPAAFNEAMLNVIFNNYDKLTAEALELLKQKEQQALVACEHDVDTIKNEIMMIKKESD